MNLKNIFHRFTARRHKAPESMDFYIINAFTSHDENTLGNPASICIVDEFPTDVVMGKLAAQLDTAMTTFLCRTDKNDVYHVRHFSPDGNENHICGHALVAATKHLSRIFPAFRTGKDILYLTNPKYKLNATDTMAARIDQDKISIVLPAVVDVEPVTHPQFYKDLCHALGVSEDRIKNPVYFAPRANNYLVVLERAEDLTGLKPDFKALNALSHEKKFIPEKYAGAGDDIVPFWCLTAKAEDGRYDILNRVFSPDIGVDEDPACGSANCSIIPYWQLTDEECRQTPHKIFKVLYPYPPGGKDAVGGVQQAALDIEKNEITLMAEAVFKECVALRIPQDTAHRKPQRKGKNPGV